ncbi:MAG: glutaconyl-CoA/methylmalonyl-CoA decarboxylase subunit delta [Bacillota bacterium]|nr:glutaconyl-CoA/methylmalonyl-CoA decarboxylase subunit delta [Bacillota bacterium]MDK2925406.1 glutaconyl-CoA/methylmalonyl-CoA decarboxylase subunit delta [Bacillota bacterium]MDK2959970.1 glutaconyl-CoA/methylmalonyl-CoA decarboxylase subunit delta [Bacillota bacterium]
MEPKIGALTLTIIDMAVVFAVLWGLALLINLTKWLVAREKKGEAVAVVVTEGEEKAGEEAASQPCIAPAVLAAITAAITAYLGDEGVNLRLSSFRRVDRAENWTAAGRMENVGKAGNMRTGGILK